MLPIFQNFSDQMTAIPDRTGDRPAGGSWLAVVRGKFPAVTFSILYINGFGGIMQGLMKEEGRSTSLKP